MIKFELTEDKRHLKVTDYELRSHLEYLKGFFSKKSPNSDFNAQVDAGIWDGMDHFMTKDGMIPVGLWKEVWNFSESYDIEVYFDVTSILDKGFKKERYIKFVNALYKGVLTDKGEPFYPRDYQFEGAFRALKYKFCCEELATSSGKTSIFHIYNSYLKFIKKIDRNNKALIVVPNVNLVKQTKRAFEQYSNGLVEWNICTIGGNDTFNVEKFEKCDILITTYQSMINLVPKCLEKQLESLIMKPLKKKEDKENRAKDITDLKRKIKAVKLYDICSHFRVINIDECLHPDTLITMLDGSKKEIKDIKKGEFVKTINDKTFKIEINEIDYIYKNLSKNNQMFEIELENGGIIKITGNHKVKLINGSYKRVDKLTLDDEILSIFD